MQQDIESTKTSFTTPKKALSHPAIIYVEYASGNIAPIIVTKSDEEATYYSWDQQVVYKDSRYKRVEDALLLSTTSQSQSRLFIRENASPEDISRVLGQAKKNKRPGEEPKK